MDRICLAAPVTPVLVRALFILPCPGVFATLPAGRTQSCPPGLSLASRERPARACCDRGCGGRWPNLAFILPRPLDAMCLSTSRAVSELRTID